MPRTVAIALLAWSLGCNGGQGDPRGEDRDGPKQLPYDIDQVVGDQAGDREQALNAAESAPELAPRQAIAGHTGMRVRTRVEFLSNPFEPHISTYSFIFPDRALVRLENPQGGEASRALTYRRGERAFRLSPGQSDSLELTSGPRETVLRRFELRRAFHLFPEGFDWSAEPSPRVELSLASGSAGSLIARLGEEGELLAMEAFDAQGEQVERLERMLDDDAGQRRFGVYEGDQHIAVESILERDDLIELPDWRFLPPDRRVGRRDGVGRILEGAGLGLSSERLDPSPALQFGARDQFSDMTWPGLLSTARRQGGALLAGQSESSAAPFSLVKILGPAEAGSASDPAWPQHWVLTRDRALPLEAPGVAELAPMRAALPAEATELGVLVHGHRSNQVELHFRLPAEHPLEIARASQR